MKSSGLQTYYCSKSKEPKFGFFVRLVFGLPFLRISGLEVGIKNIKRAAQALNLPKCIEFSKEINKQLETYWLKIDPELWNMF